MGTRFRIALLLVILAVAGCSSAAASPSASEGARGPGPRPPSVGVASPPQQPGGQLTPLTRRDAGPVALRSFRGPNPPVTSCDRYSQACAPEWCMTTGSLITELSTEAIAVSEQSGIIGLAPGSHLSVLGGPYGDLVAGPYPSSSGVYGPGVGAAEGAPVQVQTVRVSPDVATVRMTTPDGADSTAPTDGIATLAVPGASTSGRLSALDASGRELAGVDLPARATQSSSACRPVGPQPPKPGKQPANPAAAEREVRQAFTTAFLHAPSTDKYRALVAVENGAPLKVSIDQLRRNFPEVAETVSATTSTLVFTDPKTAVVRFTLNYSGGAPYGTRYGKALLIDGHWLVSRDTFCSPLAYAGVTCPS